MLKRTSCWDIFTSYSYSSNSKLQSYKKERKLRKRKVKIESLKQAINGNNSTVSILNIFNSYIYKIGMISESTCTKLICENS